MKWTEEDRLRCLQMVRQGHTYAEMGLAMGREPNSVKRYVQRMRRENPTVWKKIKVIKPNKAQKCWTCSYAGGARKNGWKCPWADRLIPVEGWTAEAVNYYLHNTNTGVQRSRTWAVFDCPHYEEG